MCIYKIEDNILTISCHAPGITERPVDYTNARVFSLLSMESSTINDCLEDIDMDGIAD